MQKIIDSTYSAAIDAGCDCVQVKHDGMWTQFCVRDGRVSLRTQTQDEPIATHEGLPKDLDCVLVGTSMVTLKKHFIYDCWLSGGKDGEEISLVNLKDTQYRTRYHMAKIQTTLAGEFFELVTNYPMSFAPDLWNRLGTIPHAKGLVFRNSKDTVAAPLRVVRWYAERPGELV